MVETILQNIPHYRAERLDGKGTIIGIYIPRMTEESSHRIITVEKTQDEILFGKSQEVIHEIDINTLAVSFIHNNTRFFASLSRCGKGADLFRHRFLKEDQKENKVNKFFVYFDGKSFNNVLLINTRYFVDLIMDDYILQEENFKGENCATV